MGTVSIISPLPSPGFAANHAVGPEMLGTEEDADDLDNVEEVGGTSHDGWA